MSANGPRHVAIERRASRSADFALRDSIVQQRQPDIGVGPERLAHVAASPRSTSTPCWPFIEAAEIKNEVGAALARQMACTHAVTMAVLSRAGGAYGGDRHVAIMAAAASKLTRAYAIQVETMRSLRSRGTQVIRVEKIEVSDTAQAIIGNINSQHHEV
jgi:hypothetical protein